MRVKDDPTFRFRIDNDLKDREIVSLLEEHLNDMKSVSPPESRHALDLDGLRKPDVTFWTLWNGNDLAGCGALQELSADHGEIKSMRTSKDFLRKGIASKILTHLVREAESRGYSRLSLETGSMDYFKPARRLYSKYGFKICPPFSDYTVDPNSVFLTRAL